MGYFYDRELNRFMWINIFYVIITILILIFMRNPFLESIDTTTDKVCYENKCSKTTLDEFNECVDLGYESSGFLSGNHYYLCDGIKVTSKCLEYEEVKTEKKYIFIGMRCEDNDAFEVETAEVVQ